MGWDGGAAALAAGDVVGVINTGTADVLRQAVEGRQLDVRPGAMTLLEHAVGAPADVAAKVEILLQAGADPNVWVWSPPLYSAVCAGNTAAAAALLRAGAARDVVSPQALIRSIPLHAAAAYGSVEMVRLLLEHEANIYCTDAYGTTALHCAAGRPAGAGALEVVKLLLAWDSARARPEGAPSAYRDWRARANAMADARGNLPLHCAARSGHVDALVHVAWHTPDLAAVNEDGQTALDLARAKGDAPMQAALRNMEVQRSLLALICGLMHGRGRGIAPDLAGQIEFYARE